MLSRALLLTLLVLPSACTQRAFEHRTRESYALDTPEAKPRLLEIQFFVSDRIVLRRESTSLQAKLTAGRVLHRKDRHVEEIVIAAGTPGVAIAADEDTITVAFSRETALVFERRADSADGESYYLRHQATPSGLRFVHIDGTRYDVDRRGSRTRLMFAEWSLTRLHKRRRVLPGRRI